MEHPDLIHCIWLQRVGMIRDGDFMRWWWVACDDRVSWLSEDIDGYHRASVGAFTWFRRSWHDFVGRMPVFSISHVRSWKHERGFGQRMGGHHFRSLFTLSPSHIELPVASPFSLARACNLFFSSPRLPITSGWGPYSACMLWLDTSWVPDLTYIFRPHSSLFIIIFSSLTSSHHFFSGITYHHLWYSFSIFSLIIAYLTLSLFNLEWWFFTRHCMEDCHILSYHSPHG